MEGRKLTLVPYKRWMEYHRWQEQRTPHLPPIPHLTELSQVQHQLQSLMDRHDLSETEKSIKYGQLLQRLQLFHQKALDKTAPPTLKDLKALLQYMPPPPPPPPTPLAPPVTQRGDQSLPGATAKATQEDHEEETKDLFQTPTAAPIPSKIAATWLTPSPTPQREELKSWVKKMMSTSFSTEPQKKKKKDEGNPELQNDKKAKSSALPLPPPPPPPLPLSLSSTPVAHRTRKHVSKPTSSTSTLHQEWLTY